MADSEPVEGEEAPQEAPAGQEGGGKKKRGLPKVVVLAALVLVLAGGGFVGFKKVLGGPKKPEKPTVKSVVELEEFLVNLYQSSCFLKCTIALGLSEEAGKGEEGGGGDTPVVRDAILMILTSKRESDISTPAGKEKLKHEIRDAVNRVMASEHGGGHADNSAEEPDKKGTSGGKPRDGAGAAPGEQKTGGRAESPQGPVLEVYFTAFATS
jgi:flagellar FliL protein